MDRKRLLDWFPHFVVNLLQNRCHFLLISGIAHQSLITLQRRFDLSGTALDLLANFRSQFAAPALLGRCKKGRCSTLPIELHIAFDCDQRHPECTRDLRLSRIAIDDQLSTKKPESRQSTLLMDKHRQMAVKVVHLSIPLLKGDLRIDVCYSCRKDRQLYLWHAEIVATFGQKKQPSSPSSTRAKPSHLSSSSCLSAGTEGSGVLNVGTLFLRGKLAQETSATIGDGIRALG